MNDQLIMDNYLLLLKSTVEVYVHGTLESSFEDVRQVLKKCLTDTLSNQAATYEIMTSYGWYQKEKAPNDKISKVLNK